MSVLCYKFIYNAKSQEFKLNTTPATLANTSLHQSVHLTPLFLRLLPLSLSKLTLDNSSTHFGLLPSYLDSTRTYQNHLRTSLSSYCIKTCVPATLANTSLHQSVHLTPLFLRLLPLSLSKLTLLLTLIALVHIKTIYGLH
jgi:hypothetical protein